MKPYILPELPIEKSHPVAFYICSEDGMPQEKIDYTPKKINPQDEEAFLRVLRKFEKDTGYSLGKTKLFGLDYPDSLEGVEKKYDTHYLLKGKPAGYIQYGSIRLLCFEERYYVLKVEKTFGPDDDEYEDDAIWYHSKLESEEKAYEFFTEKIRKAKMREVLREKG